jgi:hypothetical protein
MQARPKQKCHHHHHHHHHPSALALPQQLHPAAAAAWCAGPVVCVQHLHGVPRQPHCSVQGCAHLLQGVCHTCDWVPGGGWGVGGIWGGGSCVLGFAQIDTLLWGHATGCRHHIHHQGSMKCSWLQVVTAAVMWQCMRLVHWCLTRRPPTELTVPDC